MKSRIGTVNLLAACMLVALISGLMTVGATPPSNNLNPAQGSPETGSVVGPIQSQEVDTPEQGPCLWLWVYVGPGIWELRCIPMPWDPAETVSRFD